ncbi:androglobin [Electrophorus electricus]|uniref:androglobin n=1 Tax=Electrophorus electricus TaxID=8005 RepID=UPI0015D0B609|nr:androglobin [Electrophorus electricus]
MSKQPPKKKESSTSRISSSQGQSPTKEVSSLAVSSSEGTGEMKRSRLPIWPEWNETEVSAEKWDAAKGGKDGKAGKSPLSQLFEDPEGKVELPPSLKAHTWKRPSDYIVNKVPVVVENEADFDLRSANEHLLSSELIRCIISEIYIVWKVCIPAGVEDKAVSVDTAPNPWRPWEHIYSLCKVAKGHMPLYNAYGKYVVRLYWMGCWRKITIDDSLPFDDKNNLLLPATTNQSELWPMLLAKAILKLANTDVAPSSGRELGEFTIIHCLTGWIPELLPLQSRHVGKLWEFLQDAIPKFQVTEEGTLERSTSACSAGGRHSQAGECKSKSPTLNKEKQKEKKKSKEGERERMGNEATSTLANEYAFTQSNSAGQPTDDSSESPQMVVCASFQPLHLQEKKTSMLGQMADSSERLRQYGLSQLYSHPVLLMRTRACSLVVGPKTPPVSSWKLVRPRKERNITDEPKETPLQKPEQYIQVASPFLNFRLISMFAQVQLDPHLDRHGRCGSRSNLASFDEAYEGEDPSPAPHVAKCNRLSSLDSAHTTEVSAEDKKKDESALNDAEAAETEASSVPIKEKEKEREQVWTAKESSTTPPQDMVASTRAMLQETWVHLHDFPQCFQTLLVFHKPNTYTHHSQKSQFKSSITARMSATALTNMTGSTNSTLSTKLPGSCVTTSVQGPDEKASYFLFVDNLLPTEILICFSALVHWGDSVDEIKGCVSRTGVLTAEPFSWKSIIFQFPQVNIRTTACKAAILSLLPGRHVFCIHMRAPLGFHVQLYSMTSFVFGEEETVMAHLNKESLRFCEQAGLILRALGGVVGSFSDPQMLPSASRALEEALCPVPYKKVAHREHLRVFNEAIYHMFCSVLGRKLTSEELFAMQALTEDRTLHCSNRKDTDTPSTDGASEGWSSQQATEQEKQAATILQAGWKGYLEREILKAARPGSEENQKVTKTLLEMWASVELNIEKHAVSLLRYLITHSKHTVELYPCGEDEWTRISFADYVVPVPEISTSWVLLFREVFHVPKAMLLVPKIYSPIPACILHVINNDTGEEVPRVFHRVEPYVYTQNKAGYTFVAEAYTRDTPLVGGKWRMCLIGSREPLPQLARDTPANNFSMKEIKDYFIPNEKNIICRCAVKVSCDHVATVQFQTSKADVHIKLSILDCEREVASNQGKGHVIIPIYCFSARNDSTGSAEERVEARRSEDVPGGGQGGGRGKEAGLEDPLASEHQPAQVAHKYIVQAELLHKSWPLDDSLLAFIQTLRDMERNEMRVVGDKAEDIATPASVDLPTSEAPKATTPKTTKKSKEKEKDKPASKSAFRTEQTLDLTKPHWTLCVASEPSAADRIEVRKDTERLEQIRAIKQAWETAEPGRAAKALQSRQQYINKQWRQLSGGTAEGGEAVTRETGIVTALHHYNYDMDYTHLIRRSGRPVCLKDALIEEEQWRERSERIQSFRLLRDTVLEHRKQELVSRRELKRRQLETYDSLQVMLAEQRRKILQTREAFRSRLLEEESRKKETELTLEEFGQTDLEKNPLQPAPPTARKSGSKKK